MSPWRTLQWRRPGALEPGARDRQHVERQIDAEPALDVRAEQLEHAAGAGAEVEQRAERPVGQRLARSRASTAASATCSSRMRSHSAAWARK